HKTCFDFHFSPFRRCLFSSFSALPLSIDLGSASLNRSWEHRKRLACSNNGQNLTFVIYLDLKEDRLLLFKSFLFLVFFMDLVNNEQYELCVLSKLREMKFLCLFLSVADTI
ncbi:unnamed protein product, partial [Prunus brigantina]